MAVLTQDALKTLFETNDVPTQQDFIDLIDTLESNSAVESTSIAGTGNIWEDVNSTTTIIQTSKQINILLHNGTFYLFNGGIGSYGLGFTSTDVNNYKQISTQVTDDVISVQSTTVYNTDTATDMTVLNMINTINTSQVFTHLSNQTTIIKYLHLTSLRKVYYYLFTGLSGTYGLGNIAVSTENFKEVAITEPESLVSISTSNITGVGDVWADVNATQQIITVQSMLNIIHHNGSVYLFNPALDANNNLQIYGAGGVVSTSNNYKLISGPNGSQLLETRSMNSSDYENSVAQDFDFSLYDNFYISIDDTTAVPSGQALMTTSNLVDGKRGYIRIERIEQTGIGDQWNWQSPFLVTDLTWDWTANVDSVQYFQYEIIGDRVVIYKIATWDRPFP